jgi:AraC-like DNA-binding protein
MKPVLMRHVEVFENSFKAWANGNPYIHNPWHFHPECEISFIKKGRGMLFIGDELMNFKNNDLILIGPNLPHEWRSDINKNPDLYSNTLAVHFLKDFPGEFFYQLPEAASIKTLLEQSFRGIKVEDFETVKTVEKKLLLLTKAVGIERLNLLFSILDSIIKSPKLTFLTNPSFIRPNENEEKHRIKKVFHFVAQNFKNPISNEVVADLVNMTPTSFCRFFKTRTNKSFIKYVNEIRIAYACKLLYEESMSISQIAYESGFENLSNFNKQFKNLKGITPSEFLKNFLN